MAVIAILVQGLWLHLVSRRLSGRAWSQLVVTIIGIVIGLPAWAARPVWFHLAAREALLHGVPVRPQDHPQAQEDVSCPTSTASTTSP